MIAPLPDAGLVRDRFRGALLGHATGDALGAPADFLTAEQIEERYGVITEMLGGGWHELQPGQATDATEMMLCLAESLAQTGDFDPEDTIARYLAWSECATRREPHGARSPSELPLGDALGCGLATGI